MNPYKKCSCGKMMAWLKTSNNKNIPVDVETLSDSDRHELAHGLKVVFDPKRHTSHFATCPNSEKYRKEKKKDKPVIEKAPVIYE
jgi:hypothetical protein